MSNYKDQKKGQIIDEVKLCDKEIEVGYIPGEVVHRSHLTFSTGHDGISSLPDPHFARGQRWSQWLPSTSLRNSFEHQEIHRELFHWQLTHILQRTEMVTRIAINISVVTVIASSTLAKKHWINVEHQEIHIRYLIEPFWCLGFEPLRPINHWIGKWWNDKRQ